MESSRSLAPVAWVDPAVREDLVDREGLRVDQAANQERAHLQAAVAWVVNRTWAPFPRSAACR